MTDDSFFVLSWTIDESEREVTSIRAYGLNKNNENVCLRIHDFTPYVYVQLPEGFTWTEGLANVVCNKIDDLMGRAKPLTKKLVFKKKLYYAELSANKQRKLYPFLFLAFSSVNDIRLLTGKLYNKISIPQVGILKLKVHESNAPVILQLSCYQDIPTAGWIKFRGNRIVSEADRVTNCTFEYEVKYRHLFPMKDCNWVVSPLILGYDIEVYSANPNKMPCASNPTDVIFQISCVLNRNGEAEDKAKKILLSLLNPDKSTVGQDVLVKTYENECELLLAFVNLIQEWQPNVICGYNIFTFDIPYMINRAKHLFIADAFDRQGLDRYGHAQEKTISWSSSAYKNQSFQYLEAEGRLYVDLLPIVKRDYKLNDYSLKTVSNNFLGETKDPLTAKGIFKCFDLGRKNDEKGNKAMGIVGKYCVQDSALVVKLFEKLQIWFGLTEMASICNVSVFDLFTRGQQLKVFSQVYKVCMNNGVVVERDGYVPKEDEHYMGAHVFDPVPGVYDCVVPFDFASLYPSIIIAYNIDYSTLVPNDSDIPDSECHIFEWDEHVGCIHEEKSRKVKPKYILCGHRRFRFLKSPKGILPTLLENLLAARKKTREEIKDIENKMKSGDLDAKEKEDLQTILNVLDKRQLSYKVSANSGYGAMGVSKGFLPLMPGAMCVTAKGRQSIELVAKLIPEQFGGKLVYGDTDSNYVVFPHLKTPQEIWAHAEKVSAEVSKHFPKPMKLEFEKVIYWRFLILTRKRYMSLKCDEQGNVSKKIEKKGVLLSRRDNSNFVRSVYSDIIMKIFDRQDEDAILYDVVQHIHRLFSRGFCVKDYVITKSVGSLGNGEMIPEPIPDKKNKGLLGNYTIPLLSKNEQERKKQLLQKQAATEKEFYLKCLPSQVQLAERIRSRGGRIDVGVRLEFLVLQNDNPKAKVYDKIESVDYYTEHASILKVDYLYYLKALANPLDQVLECTISDKKRATDFCQKILKTLTVKEKVLQQLKDLFVAKLIFEGEEEKQTKEKKMKKKKEVSITTIDDESMDGFFLFTDGACKGNPGESGAGAVLYENGKEIVSDYKYLGTSTNNVAEYHGLLLGVEMCKNIGLDLCMVNVRSDSLLLIKQLKGEYKPRNAELKKLFDILKIHKFKSIEHVYREKNARADALANLGVNAK